MQLKNTTTRFGFIHKSFHWIMAALIFCLLCSGFQMENMPPGPDKIWLVYLHKSLGVTILVLACGRVVWRFISPRPAPEPTIKAWEETLARIVHFLLYFAFFAMPLSGWIMSSAGEYPVSFFGLFNLPPIVPKNPDVMHIARTVHNTLAVVALVVIGLHFAGAAKHHVIDRDNTLRRMTWDRMSWIAGFVLLMVLGSLYLVPAGIYANGVLNEEEEPQAVQQVAQNEQQVRAPVTGEWVVDKANSSIKFTAMQSGESFTGEFKDFNASIVFDPETMTGHVSVTIPIAGFTTGTADRDQEAMGTDWFNAAQFPEAVFTADSFSHVEYSEYVAHGILVLHGVSKAVDLNFNFSPRTEGNRQIADVEGGVKLKRTDFGIGQGQWAGTDTIADEIGISVYVKASRDM